MLKHWQGCSKPKASNRASSRKSVIFQTQPHNVSSETSLKLTPTKLLGLSLRIDERREPLLELIDAHGLTLPETLRFGSLGRDQHAAHNVDNAILGNAVLSGHTGEAIDLDLSEGTMRSNIDAQGLVLKESRQINMEVTLAVFLIIRWTVVGIRVESLIRNDVVLQESLEILLAIGAEEESVDARTELLEGPVGWREESTAGSMVGSVEGIQKTCLSKTERKSRELARQKADNVDGLRRREKDSVNSVDNAVGTELDHVVSK